MPDSELIEAMRLFKAGLKGRDTEQLLRMAKMWAAIEQELLVGFSAYAAAGAEAAAAGLMTPQIAYQLARQQGILNEAHAMVQQFEARAAKEIAAERLIYAGLGNADAVSAIQIAYAGYPSFANAGFQGLPNRAIEKLVAGTQKDAPLGQLLDSVWPQSSDGIVQGLLNGVARGLGPGDIAKEIAERFGVGLDRAMLIARTEQLRAYRLANVESYRESGVVKAFKRLATKDERTCLACLFSDGELIPLGEELTDHPNGRCVAVPWVEGLDAPTWESGREWFTGLDPDKQEEMLGPERFELWQSGAIPLAAFREDHHSEKWGDAPRVANLEELQKIAENGGERGPDVDDVGWYPL